MAGYGLDVSGWPDPLTRPDALAGADVKAGSGGTFPELLRVTANTEKIRVWAEESPGAADAYNPSSAPAEGDATTIKEILGQIPDVAAVYERTFSEHSRRLRAEVSYTGLLESRMPGEEIPPDEKTRRHAWLGVVPSPLGYPPWAGRRTSARPAATAPWAGCGTRVSCTSSRPVSGARRQAVRPPFRRREPERPQGSWRGLVRHTAP